MLPTDKISSVLGLPTSSIAQVLSLHEEGNTIPFIARYRKERTGGLDEVAIKSIIDQANYFKDLQKRKEFVLDQIKSQNKLTPELQDKIKKCFDDVKLEDIYLPFKKKKKTKATLARENGLEPLAKIIMAQNTSDIHSNAKRFLSSEYKTSQEVIDSALHIVKEWISENEYTRERFRETFRRYSIIHSKVVKSKTAEASIYKDYFDHSEKIAYCPSHRFLAIMRGESEGLLRVKIKIDEERALEYLAKKHLKRQSSLTELIIDTCKSALKEYLLPSLENQIKKEFKEKADEEAIKVFSNNLEQLLLAPPLESKPVLAIDPGFRTGCKIACIDQAGNFLSHGVIYPHPPQNKTEQSRKIISDFIEKHKIKAIAIGNGTASRETKTWIDQLDCIHGVEIFVISESGASIYSASELARKEFPNLDLTIRGAISLARRLLDPLSELIKVDPKSIGVGQYQHDVNQSKLKHSLDHTVISCVNRVGIDINTTSSHLLSYVSGLGPTLAKNILEYRSKLGKFQSIEQLKKVPRLGPKAFEQAAGFLRIRNGIHPLDNTGIHPESYHIVERIARDTNSDIKTLIQNKEIIEHLDLHKFTSNTVGLETLNDIKSELLKPGHDPRGIAEAFDFDKNIKSLDDLYRGMTIPGIVSNLTNFGAFVDIGIKENGLIHISQMSDRRINNPMEILSLDQKVNVEIIDIDFTRKRISLKLVHK